MTMTNQQLRRKLCLIILRANLQINENDMRRLMAWSRCRGRSDWMNIRIETNTWGENAGFGINEKFEIDLSWGCTKRTLAMAISVIQLYSDVAKVAAQCQALIETTTLK